MIHLAFLNYSLHEVEHGKVELIYIEHIQQHHLLVIMLLHIDIDWVT